MPSRRATPRPSHRCTRRMRSDTSRGSGHQGRSAIARAWKDNVGSGGNRLRIDIAEVEQTGDWAHEVGRFTIRRARRSRVSAGKYIVIWARQPSGEWRTRRDIFNWDIPPRQPLAASGVQ